MARRFYLASTVAAQVSPSFDGWGNTASGSRRRLLTTAGGSADPMASVVVSYPSGDATAVARQFVSEPVAGGENILGTTVTCYARCQESNADDNLVTAMSLRVVANDGSDRVTLVLLGERGSGAELVPSVLVNRMFASGQAIGNITLQRGERIVLEVGVSTSGVTPTATLRFGSAAASDLPQDEVSTSDFNPWIEFSSDIVMLSDVATVTAVGTHAPTTSLVGQEG